MALLKEDAVYIGSAGKTPQYMPLKWGNRHGLIAGATGTGKTVTLQGLAESFSNAGVPVFLADVKGDLSGLCMPSDMQDFLVKRAEEIGFAEQFRPCACPVVFWDIFGEKGHPVRATVSEMGPLLLSRILELSDAQEGVLEIAFRVADEEGLLLLDLKDLQSFLSDLAARREEISARYGNVAAQSVATIQRNLLRLESQGGEKFFAEPALDIMDFIKTDIDGRGHVNIMAADKLMNAPRLYATFLLWLLSELFEILPEAGDLSKPRLVFFFDEAHLLFNDAPKGLLEKVEQVVRLIRSKGVGVYFVTQNPDDVPESVLGQLGNRIQHALRAFTPRQQKAIKDAAQTYRPNPAFKVEDVITELAIGEALVSVLDEKGQPGIVEKTLIRPPCSKLGPASADCIRTAQQAGGFVAKYAALQDRESAYEILKARAEGASRAAGNAREIAQKTRNNTQAEKKRPVRSNNRQSVTEVAVKSAVRSMSSSVGRMIVREVMRGIMGGMRR